MRKTLYIKDDDYRYSFLYGSFITLTNLSEDDWTKITGMRLSPLYVSVHAMQEDVRQYMLGCKQTTNIKEDLKRLKEAGIEVHTQVVVCPGINDGEVLEDTIEQLAEFFPSVASVGIVPVGLTRYRDQLPQLEPVSGDKARELIEMGNLYQKRYRKRLGTGFVYLADELYLGAGIEIPPDEYYDDYCQLENGIGLCRLFLEEFREMELRLPQTVSAREVFIVTGMSAIPVLERVVCRLRQIRGLKVKLIPVANQFFGGQVTVTGLLTGRDIMAVMGQAYKGKSVLLPQIIFKQGQDVLLDDISLQTIIKTTGANIQTVDGSARDLVEKILGTEASIPKRR